VKDFLGRCGCYAHGNQFTAPDHSLECGRRKIDSHKSVHSFC
jgi:hypothetical protein